MNRVVTLLFLRQGDKILLAMKKRGFGAGRWNGVGGKLDRGETVEQALVRECQEEIGVTPTSYHKVAEHDFVMDEDAEQPWHMYVHTFISDTWQGDPVETEEMAPQWLHTSEIPYDKMWEDDAYWLPQVLEGKLLKTTFVFDTTEHMTSQTIIEVQEF